MVQIEIDGTVFCGCLYQDNNSFAPVKFGPPKRAPLPRLIPSNPKPAKRKKNAEASADNAYSRENYPRVYIDPYNTVEQRLRFGRDKNLSNDQSINPPQIGGENSHARAKKVGVLVYNKWKKSSSYDRKSKNSAENYSRSRRSGRLCKSFCELQQISVIDDPQTKSNNKFSAIELGHAIPKSNKVNNVRFKGKNRKLRKEISLSPKPNLRPRRAKYGSDLESIDSDLDETLSSQCPLIDLTESPPECDEIQHPTDVDKSSVTDKSRFHQISQHRIINLESKDGSKKAKFDTSFLRPTLNVDKTAKSSNNAKEEVNDLLKSKCKKKRRKAFEKEYSALSDKFEKMTIRETSFLPPVKQSSSERELDSQGVCEEVHFKISGTEMQDYNSATADSKPTNRSKLFFEEWSFIKDDQNASSESQTKELRSGKRYQSFH